MTIYEYYEYDAKLDTKDNGQGCFGKGFTDNNGRVSATSGFDFDPVTCLNFTRQRSTTKNNP